MKKYAVFCFCMVAYHQLNFSISSLSELSFDTLFDHKTWTTQKVRIKKLLEDGTLPGNFFKGQTVIGLDFSGLNLRGKDLTNCKFYKVNLANTDLTNTTFDNTKFEECNLANATIFYSGNKIFKIKSNQPHALVKQYSDLMKAKKKAEKADLTQDTDEALIQKEKAEDLGQQAKCLNHLFNAIKLELTDKKLKKFNLIDINFQNANLKDSKLQGARLSKDFKVPPYNNPNDLFDEWKNAVNNDSSNKQDYNKLIHAKFNILKDLSNEHFHQIKWEGLNLRNSNLSSYQLQLQGVNLSGVNFAGATLCSANLMNTTLINIDLTNANLIETKLQGAQFSEDFQLNYNQPSDLFEPWVQANKNNTPEKIFYNQLVQAKFEIFQDISCERIQAALQEGYDVGNANLSRAQLGEICLSGINLKNAMLIRTDLNASILKNINFTNTLLYQSIFIKSTLEKINFDCSTLEANKFIGANLKSVSFKGANLRSADFTDATLENVDFFAADIACMRLSKEIALPDSQNDANFVKFYHSCSDPKAKALLKIILESRDIILDTKS